MAQSLSISGTQASAPAASTSNPEILTSILPDLKNIQQINASAYESAVRQLQGGGAAVVLSLPTHHVVASAFANRSPDAFKNPEFQELKDSISRSGGNTVPIAVRPIQVPSSPKTGAEAPPYEIVFGHRRHQACRELGLPVRAVLLNHLDDQALALAMFNENESRASLSPWEAGAMYKTWMQHGLYKSQNELARAIGRSPADVSRALRIARLPTDVVAAFESPLHLQYRDADEIERLLALNEAAVLDVARALAMESRGMSRTEVLKRLAAAAEGEGVGSSNTPKKRPLLAGKSKVGSAVWDDEGAAVIRLAPGLPAAAQQKVEEAIARLVAREMAAAVKATPPSKSSPAK